MGHSVTVIAQGSHAVRSHPTSTDTLEVKRPTLVSKTAISGAAWRDFFC